MSNRCRYCAYETFIGDAHPCCARWMGQQEQPRCLACEASRAFKRREVSPTTPSDDTPDVQRIDWHGLTIREQFPWTRTIGEQPPTLPIRKAN